MGFAPLYVDLSGQKGKLTCSSHLNGIVVWLQQESGYVLKGNCHLFVVWTIIPKFSFLLRDCELSLSSK